MIAALGVFGGALEFIVDERQLLFEKTLEHVILSGAAIAIALAIAIPLGVWLGHLHRGSLLAINASNVGRALPSLAVIAVALVFLPFGFWPVLVALVIVAVPPILTNAYVAVDEVEPEAVEAAKGMGMTPWQILRSVELPLALPLLFAGIRTAAVFVVATATIAADRRRGRARRDPVQPGELPDRGPGRAPRSSSPCSRSRQMGSSEPCNAR